MELIVLGLVTGLSFLSYALWKRSRTEGLDEALAAERAVARLTSSERTVHTLRPGDVVSHLERDYLVEGTLVFDEEGRITRIHRVADGAAIRWLAAWPGEREPLLLDEARDLGPLALEVNAPDQLVHGGTPYRLQSRGSARVRRIGAVGEGREGERARIYGYAAPGARRLVAVAWAGRTDAFAGETVATAMLDILPGA